jgi:hypothetical protein
MSDTPETDAQANPVFGKHSCATVLADFARKLERERDGARQLAEEFHRDQVTLLLERENAQKELSSVYQWIKRNHADGFIDSLTYFQNLERVTDNWYDRLDRMEREIKELIYIGERAIALADIDLENDKFGVVSELRSELEQIKEGKK